RMDPVAAAVLLTELSDGHVVLERRRAIAARYNSAFGDFGIVRNPVVSKCDLHGVYVYVVELDERDAIRRSLRQSGVETALHYPRLIFEQTAHRDLSSERLDRTRWLAPRMLSLPCDEYLTGAETEHVIEAMRRALRVSKS